VIRNRAFRQADPFAVAAFANRINALGLLFDSPR
jgi:hypothetical protein